MSILKDMDDMWTVPRAESAKVASLGLFLAQTALSKCAIEAMKEHGLDVAEAISDWDKVLTVAAEMLMGADEPPTKIDAPERLALLARVMRYDKELTEEAEKTAKGRKGSV